MTESVYNKVMHWARNNNATVDFISIWQQITYLEEKRFIEYQPTIGPNPDFRTRLMRWINYAAIEADQQTLLQLVALIFFVGSKEFGSLYRVAFNGQIIRWLIDSNNLTIDQATTGSHIKDAISRTWFCSITDSMQIASFHHVNKIEGRDYRPDWQTLMKFGDPLKIKKFMKDNGLNNLVLLEDFVGSGSQMYDVIKFAANTLSPPHRILIIPLIICPRGNEIGRQLTTHYNNLTFEPVLIMGDKSFVRPHPAGDVETDLVRALRDLVQRLHTLVTGGPPDPTKKPYSPFGFDNTGSLLVMYTNCPDNTLPIIHHGSSTWYPIFPRSSRL